MVFVLSPERHKVTSNDDLQYLLMLALWLAHNVMPLAQILFPSLRKETRKAFPILPPSAALSSFLLSFPLYSIPRALETSTSARHPPEFGIALSSLL